MTYFRKSRPGLPNKTNRYLMRPTIALLAFLLVFQSAGLAFAADQESVLSNAEPVVVSDSTDVEQRDDQPAVAPQDTPSSIDLGKAPIDETETISKAVPEFQELSSTSYDDGVAKLNVAINSVMKNNNIKTDELTGALGYQYVIDLPKGRNGLTPQLSLEYNSQNKQENGIVGYGWSLSIPFIERINKTGTEKIYSSNYFSSSLFGELVSYDNINFKPKVVNEAFVGLTFQDNNWVAIEKNGTKYKYGVSQQSKQDNPGNPTQIFKWMLEEVVDTNGNSIKYIYTKDSGQIYPQSILYSFGLSGSEFYKVDFVSQVRQDINKSYATTFLVETKLRIQQVNVYSNGALAHKIDLTYGVGDAGMRSMLSEILLTAYDESFQATQQDPIKFEYQKTQTAGWTLVENQNTPPIYTNQRRFLADVTGDNYPDIVRAVYVPNQDNEKVVYKNNTNKTWSKGDMPMLAPDYFYRFETRGGAYGSEWDNGLRLVDLNGDMLSDVLISIDYQTGGGKHESYLNQNGQQWQVDNKWISQILFTLGSGTFDQGSISDFASYTVDLNGDGLSDIIRKFSNNPDEKGAQFNNGQGFDPVTQTWDPPVQIIPRQARLADFNNDGLVDIMYTQNDRKYLIETKQIWLNNGLGGWILDSTWTPPHVIDAGNMEGTNGQIITDFNGDGLVDYATDFVTLTSSNYGTYLNSGNGWVKNPAWNMPITLIGGDTQMADIDVDGMIDFHYVATSSGLIDKTYFNNGRTTDILSKITTSDNGTIDVSYQKLAEYKDAQNTILNPEARINLDVVKTISMSDGMGSASVANYTYEGGQYYFNGYLDRKFAGFAKVTAKDSVGNSMVNYYHQGNTSNSALGEFADHGSKIGKIYRTEKTDSSGNLHSVVINKWENVDLGSGSNFVKNTQTITLDYDGNSTHKDKAVNRAYNNANGNLTQEIQWGEVTAQTNGTFVDQGTDKTTTNITYATGSANNVISAPAVETTVNQSNVKIKETRHYYDVLLLNAVSLGNETKTEYLKKLSSSYVNTQKTYNAQGLVLTEKDGNGRLTTYTYDLYNLYPSEVKNALNQISKYEYNYATGQVKKVTTPNNLIFTTVYDGLGRVIEEKQPDITVPSTLVTKASYVYTNLPVGYSIKKTEYLDTLIAKDSYQYFDGLGRLIQTRADAEDTDNFSVVDTVYNNLGQVWKQSLPYFSTGSALTPATSDTALYVINTYDALGRVVSVINAVSTVTSVFDDWTTLITDARSKPKKLYYDARGQLVRVDEYNAGNVYTTSYTYSPTGDLLKISDALGNVRNFTYDLLGNRLTAQDLHAPADTTFSTWSYAYDNNNNLTKSVDGKAQTINYSYDALNRIKSETHSPLTAGSIAYTYDSCVNGKGQICTVTVSGGPTTKYEYNPLGQVSKETRTIDAVNYVTLNTYNRQNNLLTTTLPDGYQVKYSYNSAGLLETVQNKIVGGSTFTDLLIDYDYSPHGRIAFAKYANGVETANTFDAGKAYRMVSKKSLAGTVKLQDNAYEYDPAGNILKITDNSDTATKKVVDYTYDDLSRLLSATATGAANNNNYSQTYSYDAVGNILTKSDVGGAYAYAGNTGTNYANPHAVTSVGTDVYNYDQNGNLSSVTGTVSVSHSYDYNNRLVGSTVGASVMSYVYDHSGQRVKNIVDGVATVYPSKAYNVKGGVATRHIYAGDDLLATVEGANMYTALTDHLTGVSLMLKSTTKPAAPDQPAVTTVTVAELVDYYPYGSMRLDEKTGTFTEQRKFAGHEYDTGSGLSYMEARYYNGVIGKFISQDPAYLNLDRLDVQLTDPQSWNSYAYARNNPLKYNDPDGQFWDTVMDLGFVVWDGGRSIEHLGKWLGDHASVAVGKSTGFSRLENTGANNLAVSGQKLKDSGVNLSVDIGSTLVPFVPAVVGRVDDVAKVTSRFSTADIAKMNREGYLNKISDPKLQNTIKNYYKDTDTIFGGTGGAIKNELATNNPTSGKFHSDKGSVQQWNAFRNVLARPSSTSGDVSTAQHHLKNLYKALTSNGHKLSNVRR